MFVVAMGLYALSSFVILFMEFKKMVLVSRIFLLIQFAALFMMVVAWLGISFWKAFWQTLEKWLGRENLKRCEQLWCLPEILASKRHVWANQRELSYLKKASACEVLVPTKSSPARFRGFTKRTWFRCFSSRMPLIWQTG
jgi:hypothetical protein